MNRARSHFINSEARATPRFDTGNSIDCRSDIWRPNVEAAKHRAPSAIYEMIFGNWYAMREKAYAVMIMIVQLGQITPLHFHHQKTGDIINRGGGLLDVQLYASTAEEALSEADVMASVGDTMLRALHGLPPAALK